MNFEDVTNEMLDTLIEAAQSDVRALKAAIQEQQARNVTLSFHDSVVQAADLHNKIEFHQVLLDEAHRRAEEQSP